MSKLSRFLIVVIILGLAFIASLRMYRAYEQTVQEQQAAAESVGQNLTQGNKPSAPVIQVPVFQKMASIALSQEVYVQDATLPEELSKEQARQTMRSILDDYKQDPQLQAFYAQLRKSTGESLDLAALSGENMTQLLVKYPQIQEIIAQHMQNPQFAKTLQEIFSNPQFVHSVAVLQQANKK